MDTLTPAQRSEHMRRIRSRDTRPEVSLRRLVWSLGYRYRKNRRGLIGSPDLAFVGRKRAIFLHGCFWHRHRCSAGVRVPKSRVDYWKAKFTRNVHRDAVVMRQLKSVGWRALVIWECQLADTSRVARRIRKFLDA
ncbi:MAG: very short patch repair endonuclease [Rhizomicrobium sp.]|jgi:DNA mismatch endonuclease (patch repair protein)